MDLRKSFDIDAVNYDRWRPRYCKELFNDIIDYSKLDSETECLEIGCGTGQATEPVLNTGSSVLAIELGQNFTEYTRNKFSNYKNFCIENADFEKIPLQDNKFDLVFSGTAFHWIPEEIGYPKVFDILKSGGAISVFWNKPAPKSFNDPLHLKMQKVYEKYFGPGSMKKAEAESDNPQERYKKIIGTIEKYGFIEAECRLYRQVREFNAEDYIALISTYSDHIALPEPVKSQFFNGIRGAIHDFNNSIKVYDTIDLYMARKP